MAEPEEDVDPGQTSIPGVYVAGAASGAKDIADSILHAGAAAAQVAAHLEQSQVAAADRAGAGMSEQQVPIDARPIGPPQRASPTGRRIGVYVCHCGGNISDYVDVDKVIDDIRDDGDVVVSRTAMFACSDATQQDIDGGHRGQRASTAWSWRPARPSSTPTPSGASRHARASIPTSTRRSTSASSARGSHTDDPERGDCEGDGAGQGRHRTHPATRFRWNRSSVETIPHTLVVGGGIAGLRAAIGLADIGLKVTLVERELELGGWVRGFGPMFPHDRKGS